MTKVMMTVRAPGAPPTLDALKQRFGLGDEEVDARFGLVPVDPDAGTYTLMVEQDAAARMRSDDRMTVKGPFSNPPIAPAGE